MLLPRTVLLGVLLVGAPCGCSSSSSCLFPAWERSSNSHQPRRPPLWWWWWLLRRLQCKTSKYACNLFHIPLVPVRRTGFLCWSCSCCCCWPPPSTECLVHALFITEEINISPAVHNSTRRAFRKTTNIPNSQTALQESRKVIGMVLLLVPCSCVFLRGRNSTVNLYMLIWLWWWSEGLLVCWPLTDAPILTILINFGMETSARPQIDLFPSNLRLINIAVPLIGLRLIYGFVHKWCGWWCWLLGHKLLHFKGFLWPDPLPSFLLPWVSWTSSSLLLLIAIQLVSKAIDDGLLLKWRGGGGGQFPRNMQ